MNQQELQTNSFSPNLDMCVDTIRDTHICTCIRYVYTHTHTHFTREIISLDSSVLNSCSLFPISKDPLSQILSASLVHELMPSISCSAAELKS